MQLTEVFTSVQGETSFTGLPTVFVRTAGCNLRCTWCDTPYSFGKGETWSMEEILSYIKESGVRHICLTGGEPLLQKELPELVSQLIENQYTVSIETGGSLPTTSIDPRAHIIYDIKCPGSGMEHKNLYENLERLTENDEVKFVIADERDYVFAAEICEKYSLEKKAGEVLFSPVFDQLEAKTLVEWILRDQLPVRLNLQVHKFIWDPQTKGV